LLPGLFGIYKIGKLHLEKQAFLETLTAGKLCAETEAIATEAHAGIPGFSVNNGIRIQCRLCIQFL